MSSADPFLPPVPSIPDAASSPVLAAAPGELLHRDTFRDGLDRWRVEQQPGGSVRAEDGRLVIADKSGCTVWFRPRLRAPVFIRYEAVVTSRSRVSDLNCFWMASDPERPDDLFAAGHSRDGTFASYDTLQTYYVGYGGNGNTTTRFRRYDGSGARPLLPEHDLKGPGVLLEPDRVYRIELVALENGRVQYARDGEVLFDVSDKAPLLSGWFGLRTVWSEIKVTNFGIHRAVPAG
ncbi:hypothetical protein OPIT5_20705 [Opitutaceae bacterium TAV5]|nr:hypothetical protein OPIT5_20705 [Opitutaceae bacterium TAV5]